MNFEEQLVKLQCLNDTLFCIQTGIAEGGQQADDKVGNALYIINIGIEKTLIELEDVSKKVMKLA